MYMAVGGSPGGVSIHKKPSMRFGPDPMDQLARVRPAVSGETTSMLGGFLVARSCVADFIGQYRVVGGDHHVLARPDARGWPITNADDHRKQHRQADGRHAERASANLFQIFAPGDETA